MALTINDLRSNGRLNPSWHHRCYWSEHRLKRLVSMNMKDRLLHLVVPALILGTGSSIYAIPTLTLESGGVTVVRTDADDGSIDGKIELNQSVGGFYLNKVKALTDGTGGTGTPLSPDLNLLSVDASSGAGGTLTVTFVDDGFTGSPLDLLARIGGTTAEANSVQFLTYVNGTLLTDSGLLDGTGFSDVKNASISEGAPYSLTLKAIITHASGSQLTSFGARLSTAVPDGGATAIMLGVGLFGLGAFARRTTKN
jgi:hypothetical protein